MEDAQQSAPCLESQPPGTVRLTSDGFGIRARFMGEIPGMLPLQQEAVGTNQKSATATRRIKDAYLSNLVECLASAEWRHRVRHDVVHNIRRRIKNAGFFSGCPRSFGMGDKIQDRVSRPGLPLCDQCQESAESAGALLLEGAACQVMDHLGELRTGAFDR